MALAPAATLKANLIAARILTGSQVDVAVKSSVVGLTSSAPVILKIWKDVIIPMLYADLDTVYNSILTTYASTATLTFGAALTTSIAPPLGLSMSSIATASGTTLAGTITSTVPLSPPATGAAKMWELVLNQIYTDINIKLLPAITTQLNGITFAISSGAASIIGATPTITASPLPPGPYHDPWSVTNSTNFLGAQAALSPTQGPLLDVFIKSVTSTMINNTAGAGAVVWERFMLYLYDKISDIANSFRSDILSGMVYVPAGTISINPSPPPPTLPSTANVYGTIS